MKKTVLAILLPSMLYGFGISYAASVKDFKSFEKNYLKATNAVVARYAELSMGEAKYFAKFEQANDKITLNDGFVFSQNNNGVIVKYDIRSTSDVDLTQYNPKDGQAKITGESTGDIQVTIPQAEAPIIAKDIFSNAKYTLLFDEKANTFATKINIANNTIPVLSGEDKVVEVTLNDISNNAVIGFNKDYTDFTAIKSDSVGKHVGFKVVGQFSELMQLSGDVDTFSTSSNYVVAPLKLNAVATLDQMTVQASAVHKDESFALAIKDAAVKYALEDIKGLIAGDLSYKIGNFSLTKDQLPTLDFGSFALSFDIKGVKNIKDWQSFMKKLTEMQVKSQDPDAITDKEIKEIQAMFAALLTKDSRIEMLVEGKLSDADLAKVAIVFQPTEAFVKLVQKGPEAYKQAMANKTPDVLINEFIQEAKLSALVTENYMVTQYKNALTLDGKDTSQAEVEIKGGLQMFMMMAAMQAGPLGVTPAKMDNGRISIDIAFKDGQWNINGKTLTTAEIFAAFQ